MAANNLNVTELDFDEIKQNLKNYLDEYRLLTDAVNIRDAFIINIGIDFEIIEIPGHTLDHIAYFANINNSPILFCGDTLFAGGCGRIFEGTFDQMYESLMKLKKLPQNTRIYCGHEYTINNLKFAKAVEPDNIDLITRYNNALDLRKNNIPTLPSTLLIELKTNPFLRADKNNVQNNISKKFKTGINEKEIFSALRQWKDNF